MRMSLRRTLVCTAFATATLTTAAGTASADVPLGLQGATNARDIGGYHTTDGHTVRTGLVIRSNSLAHLRPSDLAALRRRDVRVIEDLRTVYERAAEPDLVPAGAVDRWQDVLGQAPLNSVFAPATAYQYFVTIPGARQAIGNVLRDIIHTNGAVLYHCSAGKDRTGWTTAVLLTILGVDRATVNHDFLLSNRYLGAIGDDLVRGVSQDELNTAFDTATKLYGSFNNYVHQGLGLTNADIAALKAKLVS